MIDPSTVPNNGFGLLILAVLQVGAWLRSEAQSRTVNHQVKNGSATKLRDDVDEILDGVRVIRADVSVLDGRVTLIEKKLDA